MWTRRLAGLSLASVCAGRADTAGAIGEELSPGLAALVAELRAVLAPAAPRAPFRSELGRDLSAVARRRQQPHIVLQRPPNYRRGLLIGAAAVSSAVSVAGLVAYLWHHRTQPASLGRG